MADVDAGSLYGNLNLLVLRVLADGPMHGLGIGRRIRLLSRDVLQIEEGALYPALHRLRRDGHITAAWGVSEQNRRAKFYELTASGRARLEREIDGWVRQTEAISRVIDLANG
jgi:PadR family transcriptional regulator